jgi:hypothetical protein
MISRLDEADHLLDAAVELIQEFVCDCESLKNCKDCGVTEVVQKVKDWKTKETSYLKPGERG